MEKYIPIVNRTTCCRVWLEEILYIEQIGRTINIVTENEEIADTCRLKDVEMYLDEYFAHCLRGTVVNFRQVQAMKDQNIVFRDGRELRLGRQSFVSIKQRFVFYMKNPELYLSRMLMSKELNRKT